MDVEKFLDRLNELYLPPTDVFTEIDVPAIRYAVISGQGSPQHPDFQEAKKWLYAVVHVLKPAVKKRLGKRYAEPPLEYLFWADDPRDFPEGNQDQWRWRVMIALIDWITDAQFHATAKDVAKKLGPAPGELDLVELQEGLSVQIMHIGDYREVQRICDKLYAQYLPANNFVPAGPYHEIYLNDPNRITPEKRRMVIRQPVKRSKHSE